MPLGNQRIFSNNNWNESGRSLEGITNIRKTRSGDILFFHLINAELFPMNDQFDYVVDGCLLYTSPSPRDRTRSRMPSSA